MEPSGEKVVLEATWSSVFGFRVMVFWVLEAVNGMSVSLVESRTGLGRRELWLLYLSLLRV